MQKFDCWCECVRGQKASGSLTATAVSVFGHSFGMGLTAAATVSVAVSSGGGLIHAEYVIVVEGGLAWAGVGAGFSVMQVSIDLADWDAFFYSAWAG